MALEERNCAEPPAFEWDAPVAADIPAPAPPGLAPAEPGAARKRERDRQVALRFAGLFARVEELRDADRVQKAARLFVQDRDLTRADELLEMAIVLSPRHEGLRLAQLEIAALRRDGDAFARLAASLHEAMPECGKWDEVRRLRRALVPARAQNLQTAFA